MTIVEYFIVIGAIGAIYWFFTRFDANQADKNADRYIRKAQVDAETEKIRLQQEELKLKQEIVRMEREKNTPKGIPASFTVKDELEDKSQKEPEPEP